jgi:hypothetical protein
MKTLLVSVLTALALCATASAPASAGDAPKDVKKMAQRMGCRHASATDDDWGGSGVSCTARKHLVYVMHYDHIGRAVKKERRSLSKDEWAVVHDHVIVDDYGKKCGKHTYCNGESKQFAQWMRKRMYGGRLIHG